ncbi:hypothetical protein QQF64_023763 [Cirrhinus molitorella]|uniref:Uncharacterized protein n=1 Tax=Cirrhinus molitorella TaxID=172907 RepID=A0ABR3NKH3_9TELE
MNLFRSFIWILTAFISASRGITVTQPEVVTVSKGETATIECKTDAGFKSSNSNERGVPPIRALGSFSIYYSERDD